MVAIDSFEKIGSTLKSARRSQRFTIRDVSQQLRISVDYLSYLENGAFDELPAPAYVTGFLRSYGQFLGLDPVPLVSRYAALSAEKNSDAKIQDAYESRAAAAFSAGNSVDAAGFCRHWLWWLVLADRYRSS